MDIPLSCMTLTDSDIIQLYLQRDQKAIECTHYKYGAYCESICRNILQNPMDVQECINDMHLAVWNSIPPNIPESLKYYVSKIIRNLALNKVQYYQAEKRDIRKTVSFEAMEEEMGQIFADSRICAEEMQLAEVIDRFLATLPKNKRKVLVLRYWYGLPIREIALKTHLNTNTVKTTLARQLKNLKKHLVKEGFYAEL